MIQKLTQYAESLFGWLKTAYSEPNGNGSSTRIHIGVLTFFTVGVGCGFAWLVHRQRLAISEFDAFLGAASAFLIATAGPLYATNKISDWAKNRDNQSSNTDANSTPPILPSA